MNHLVLFVICNPAQARIDQPTQDHSSSMSNVVYMIRDCPAQALLLLLWLCRRLSHMHKNKCTESDDYLA
jgi:cell division inhibitor SulA